MPLRQRAGRFLSPLFSITRRRGRDLPEDARSVRSREEGRAALALTRTMTIIPTTEATGAAKPAMNKGQLVALKPPRLPYHEAVEERFGIDRAGWKALVEAISRRSCRSHSPSPHRKRPTCPKRSPPGKRAIPKSPMPARPHLNEDDTCGIGSGAAIKNDISAASPSQIPHERLAGDIALHAHPRRPRQFKFRLC